MRGGPIAPDFGAAPALAPVLASMRGRRQRPVRARGALWGSFWGSFCAALAYLLLGCSFAAAQEAASEPTPLLEGNTSVKDAAPKISPSDLSQDLGEILKYYNEIQELMGAGQANAPEPQGLPSPERLSELVERLRKQGGTIEGVKQAPPAQLQDDQGPRDPFAVTGRMRRISTGNLGIEGVQFVPAEAATLGRRDLPSMRLRGLIRKASSKSTNVFSVTATKKQKAANDANKAALLEIEGAGVFVVREGDTVGLHDLGRSAVLKVIRVNELSVVGEAGSLGQVIIVR